MTENNPQTLVSTQWVADNLDDPNLRILDGSAFLPTEGRDGRAEFEKTHLPHARFFDIDDIADARSNLPHMLPSIEKFMSRVRKLGVGDGHQIVVYDAKGLFSAARVWWMFRIMGHRNVAVMDGGLPKWVSEGRQVTDAKPVIKDRHMVVDYNAEMVKDVTQVAQAAKLGDFEIVDARAADRFRGDVAEPRPGMRAGHIPGAKNVPFKTLLNEDQTFQSKDAVAATFKEAGVDLSKPIITSCGSGVTACVLCLGLELIGKTDYSVYDGSWTEWGQFPTLNIATGDA